MSLSIGQGLGIRPGFLSMGGFSLDLGGEGMCCDPAIVDDKVIVGQCADCDSDINQDGQCVDDSCSYSPLDCETCGCQPCDLSC